MIRVCATLAAGGIGGLLLLAVAAALAAQFADCNVFQEVYL